MFPSCFEMQARKPRLHANVIRTRRIGVCGASLALAVSRGL
jgi:hypothetical protein